MKKHKHNKNHNNHNHNKPPAHLKCDEASAEDLESARFSHEMNSRLLGLHTMHEALEKVKV